MKITRRTFLEAAPAAIGAVVLSGNVIGQKKDRAVATVVTDKADALSHLTWDSFYPYINTEFAFRRSDGTAVTLRLTNMEDSKPARSKPDLGQECFILTFTGPGTCPFDQDVYAVDHFALGSFDLFITAGLRSRRSATYGAVINRITN